MIAWPVSHSLSPTLHAYWINKYSVNGSYLALAVSPEDFRSTLKGLSKAGFAGVNVTLPHKETALKTVDIVDYKAQRIGAVNTVIVKEGGVLFGTNTDGYGFLANIRDQLTRWEAGSGPIVVIGAGGAARGICLTLLDEGAREIRLVNRTKARADILAGELGGSIFVVPWSEKEDVLEGAQLLINATSLGMVGMEKLNISLGRLPLSAVVYDIVYSPLETNLLATARARGNTVIDGLGMLLHQACPGFQAWFGVKPEVNKELHRFMSKKL